MPIIYYLFILPLSFLPSSILYGISDAILFPIIYSFVGYRKKVVVNNIQMAFPDKGDREVKEIARKFYHHFCDLMVESIMLFSISKEEAIKRCKLVNPEVVSKYYEEGRSLALVGAHYNNWEMLAVAIAPQMKHQVDAIYAPLTNSFMEKKMKGSRSKYGLRMVPKKSSADFIESTAPEITAMIFAIDQAPGRKQKAYWTYFFDKETAVSFGAERYAARYDWPVVYTYIRKVKRGYYEMSFEVLEDQPATKKSGFITQLHTKTAENEIRSAPEYWLWTHKRWKRSRPDDQKMAENLL